MFIKIGNFSSYLLFPILTGVFYICFVLLFNSYMVGQRKISFLCRMLLIETGNFLIIFVELVSMKLSLILEFDLIMTREYYYVLELIAGSIIYTGLYT